MDATFEQAEADCSQVSESLSQCYSVIEEGTDGSSYLNRLHMEERVESGDLDGERETNDFTGNIEPAVESEKWENEICTAEDDYAIAQAISQLKSYDIGPDEIYFNSSKAQNFQDMISLQNHRTDERTIQLDGLYVNRAPLPNSLLLKNTIDYCISSEKIEWFQSGQTDPEKAYKEYKELKKLKENKK